MKAAKKITFLQACMMLALMNGLADHVIVNPMILDTSGRDSWLTVLFTGVLFLIWCLLLVGMMRKTNQRNWREWMERSTFKGVSWLLIAPVCVELYLIGAMTVVHTANWHVTNYMPSTPESLLVLSLVVICAILALWGLQVIAITSGILLPIVVVLGFFVGISNGHLKNHYLLLPILEHGWSPIVDGMIYAGGGFVELLVFILLQHQISTKVKPWHMLAYGAFTVMITLGPIVGAITEFGPREAAKQMTSPYEQWRLLRLGQYVEHLDFFSISQWLSGATVRISLAVFLLVELLPVKSRRWRRILILIIMASYVLLSSVDVNEYDFYLWMYNTYMPISFYVLFVLSFVWMSIAQFSMPPKEESA